MIYVEGVAHCYYLGYINNQKQILLKLDIEKRTKRISFIKDESRTEAV